MWERRSRPTTSPVVPRKVDFGLNRTNINVFAVCSLQVKQPTEELSANILHMIETFGKIHHKVPDDYVEKASISCFTEYIDFIIPREE